MAAATATKSTAALIALLAAGCGVARPAGFAETARALGATVQGDRCPYSAGELTTRTLEAWRGAPQTNPYRAEFRCVALDDDLTRDGMSDCTPPPEAALATPLGGPRRITGELFYLGIDPREYSYDLVPTEGFGTEVRVRIHFEGPLASDARTMGELGMKLAIASAFWTRHSPDPRLRFRFAMEPDADAAPHFVIHLAPGAPRTPFDLTWGSAWSWHLIAHEIGHMMGLDDEYEQLRKTFGHITNAERAWDADPAVKLGWFKCDLTSLMCDSKGLGSVPQKYHYYVVLRRRFCRAAPRDFPRF